MQADLPIPERSAALAPAPQRPEPPAHRIHALLGLPDPTLPTTRSRLAAPPGTFRYEDALPGRQGSEPEPPAPLEHVARHFREPRIETHETFGASPSSHGEESTYPRHGERIETRIPSTAPEPSAPVTAMEAPRTQTPRHRAATPKQKMVTSQPDDGAFHNEPLPHMDATDGPAPSAPGPSPCNEGPAPPHRTVPETADASVTLNPGPSRGPEDVAPTTEVPTVPDKKLAPSTTPCADTPPELPSPKRDAEKNRFHEPASLLASAPPAKQHTDTAGTPEGPIRPPVHGACGELSPPPHAPVPATPSGEDEAPMDRLRRLFPGLTAPGPPAPAPRQEASVTPAPEAPQEPPMEPPPVTRVIIVQTPAAPKGPNRAATWQRSHGTRRALLNMIR